MNIFTKALTKILPIKTIVKSLIPDSQTVSDMFAETAANAINNSGKGDQIAKYNLYVARWDKVQGKLVQWFSDGKIDDVEKQELSKAIQPIVEKIILEIKR